MDVSNAIQLTASQKDAVESASAKIAVIAGPGSGKTRVLTERICHLVQEKQQDPRRILAISFSSKAAGEVAKRLKSRLGNAAYLVTVKTFHSFGLGLIRSNFDLLRFREDVEIISQSGRYQLLRRLMQEEVKRHGYSRTVTLDKIQETAQVISRMKGGYEEGNIHYRRLYDRYNEELHRSNQVDFDDMILLARKLLTENEEIRNAMQKKYDHVMVDEVQDMNQHQTDMISMLVGEHTSLFVVGDDDQCIYEWRGAEPDYLRRLAKDDSFKVIHLTDNFRSENAIVQASASFISRNVERVRKIIHTKKLKQHLSASATTAAYRLNSPQAEASFIAETISKLTANGTWQYGDMTILLRKHSQSAAIVAALEERHIPVTLHMDAGSLFDEFVQFLRAFARLPQKNNISRAINYPTRIIDNFLYEDLRDMYPQLKELSVGDGFAWLYEHNKSFEESELFRSRYAMLTSLYADMDDLSVSELLERIAQHLRNAEKQTSQLQEKLLHIGTMQQQAEEFDRIEQPAMEGKGARLCSFLDYLNLRSQDESPDEPSEQAVNIMTCHRSKGLEFPVVFIPGVQVARSKEMAPHSFVSGYHTVTGAQLEAERRLLYVSMTRAIDQLYLTCSADPFSGDGPVVKQGFLAEMPGIVLKTLN